MTRSCSSACHVPAAFNSHFPSLATKLKDLQRGSRAHKEAHLNELRTYSVATMWLTRHAPDNGGPFATSLAKLENFWQLLSSDDSKILKEDKALKTY